MAKFEFNPALEKGKGSVAKEVSSHREPEGTNVSFKNYTDKNVLTEKPIPSKKSRCKVTDQRLEFSWADEFYSTMTKGMKVILNDLRVKNEYKKNATVSPQAYFIKLAIEHRLGEFLEDGLELRNLVLETWTDEEHLHVVGRLVQNRSYYTGRDIWEIASKRR